MAQQILTLTFNDIVNVNIQVGDIVYYTTPQASGGGSNFQVNGSIIMIGVVYSVSEYIIEVIYEDDPGNTGNPTVTAPSPNDYIMFEKNKVVNSSSLIGHYADVQFVNYSTEEVELFSVGSQVSESSK